MSNICNIPSLAHFGLHIPKRRRESNPAAQIPEQQNQELVFSRTSSGDSLSSAALSLCFEVNVL